MPPRVFTTTAALLLISGVPLTTHAFTPALSPKLQQQQQRVVTAGSKLPSPSSSVGAAAAAPRRQRAAVNLQAVEQPDGFFAPEVRTPARTLGIGLVWVGLAAYVAVGAPGKDEASQALDSELLAALIVDPFAESCPPLFTVLFNFMGIWPAIYAALLLPGAAQQKPVPAAPFLAGSVALGMFSLSPYLALREFRGADASPAATQKSLNGLSRWFEGKLNGALLLAGAVGLSGYGLTAHGGDIGLSVSEFRTLFATQLFPHVTTLDFLALWVFSFGVLAEDMDRRGMDSSTAPLYCAVPLLGHCAYLLTREPLPSSE
jgi:hypothetical protein